MIKLTKVTKYFGSYKTLDQVSFQLKEGQITAFLGVNGAGKTTTMRVINGIFKPSTGTVRVGCYDPIRQPLEVRRNLGYLPENNPLYGHLRVSEYLGFTAAVRQLSGFPAKFKSLFSKMGIWPVWDKRIETLSRGYRQRVGLTAALMHSPKVLVLDEPLSGLDPVQKEEIIDLLKTIGRQTTILFSTHVLPEVESLCQQVIMIHQGRIVYDGRLSSLGQQGQVVVNLAYQGPKRVIDKLKDLPVRLGKVESPQRGVWQVRLDLTRPERTWLVKLSKTVTESGGVIIELSRSRSSLSDLFYRLTHEAGNK